jgi:hypothetical protein
MTLILFLFACGVKAPPREPLGPPQRYRADLVIDVTTEAVDASGAPVAALAPLGAFSQRYQLDLSLAFVRDYPARAEAEGAAPITPGLVGRSLELRRFPDGEVLNIGLLQHAAGGDRHGELFDLLAPVLSPRPPDLPEVGATELRTARWPAFLDRQRGWWSTLEARWTLLATERIGPDRAWKLSYEGRWKVDGGDRSQGAPIEVTGEGPARGTVWLGQADHTLIRHELDWTRAIAITYPSAPQGPVVVRQRQQTRGTVERLP